MMTRDLTIISAGNTLGDAAPILAPNPAGGASGNAFTDVHYTPLPGAAGVAVVYDLAGARVLQGGDPGRSGFIRLDLKSLSSGIYIVVLQQATGRTVLKVDKLKLAVIR